MTFRAMTPAVELRAYLPGYYETLTEQSIYRRRYRDSSTYRCTSGDERGGSFIDDLNRLRR